MYILAGISMLLLLGCALLFIRVSINAINKVSKKNKGA